MTPPTTSSKEYSCANLLLPVPTCFHGQGYQKDLSSSQPAGMAQECRPESLPLPSCIFLGPGGARRGRKRSTRSRPQTKAPLGSNSRSATTMPCIHMALAPAAHDSRHEPRPPLALCCSCSPNTLTSGDNGSLTAARPLPERVGHSCCHYTGCWFPLDIVNI